jgi:hypothetical protein
MTDFLPLIVDREIDDAQYDSFGHSDFAVLLEKVITDRTIVVPYSIGLLGPWGTGKSSIKELCIKKLNALPREAEFKIETITFNAWRFGGENLKRALLREVFLGLGGSEQEITDAMSRTLIGDSLEKKPWIEVWNEFLDKYVGRLFIALIVLSSVLLINVFLPAKSPWSPLVSGAANLLTVGLMGWLLNLDQLVISRFSSVWRAEPPRSSAEEFEVLLLAQIAKYHNAHRRVQRIVIFVDDLDRLPSEEMMTGLEAIRSFLELPRDRLPDGLGIIFVVSCDEERIAEALSRRARTDNAPVNLKDKHEGRRHLDRVFQYRLEIPPLPRADMRVFARSKMDRFLPNLITDISTSGAHIDDVIERLIHPAVTNPRQALQLINAFAQAWWFAKKREFEGSGTEQPGSLAQGSVTKYPEALAVMCVLRLDFADFYRELEEEPRLLQGFMKRFLLSQTASEGEGLDKTLNQYREDSSKEDSPLHTNHRPLRAYLSGVQSVSFPRLEPLLRLSEDHVTRRYGDSGLKIQAALVQGDAAGILEQFGRHLDTNKLDREQAALLRGFVTDLNKESLSRRVNAAAALSEICERLPEDATSRLTVLNPVAAWMRESPTVRARIGARRMKPILFAVTPGERESLLEILTTDAINGAFGPRIEALGPVTNEQRLDDCVAILEIALEFQQTGKLPQEAERAWREWLPLRQVATADEAVPISTLVRLSGQDQYSTLTGAWAEGYSSGLVADAKYIKVIL